MSYDLSTATVAQPHVLIDPVSREPYRAGANIAAILTTDQKTVNTTASQIVAARGSRTSVLITNLGTTDVFVGASGVTSANGQILPGVKGATLTLDTSAAIFGITASGSQAVSFVELYG